jgi:hypothetical protein
VSTRRYCAEWLHPIQIFGIIRRALEHQPDKLSAEMLGIKPQSLCDILKARRGLSSQVACRLHEFGLDGLDLMISQTIHSYFVACKHDPNGDPRGKKAWESPDFCEPRAKKES